MPKNSELVDEIVKHALGTQTLRRNVWKYSHCYRTLQCPNSKASFLISCVRNVTSQLLNSSIFRF